MYSLLPIFVAALFLGCGLYAISIRGINRISFSFFLLCLTTACWQGTWALLFLVQDLTVAVLLSKIGVLLVIFVPAVFYQFIAEICDEGSEKKYVKASYAAALLLALALLFGNSMVVGVYKYFWGYYPKAGPLHALHVLQTIVLTLRGAYITYSRMVDSSGSKRHKLKLCLIGLSIYSLAGVGYLSYHGVEIYPVGPVFLAISFTCFTVAIVRFDLMNAHVLAENMAASIAHELRTPLSIIEHHISQLMESMPTLQKSYTAAVANNLCENSLSSSLVDRLPLIAEKIKKEVTRSNTIIDLLLASTRAIDKTTFTTCSVHEGIHEALDRYPFSGTDRDSVTFEAHHEFNFHGSNELLVFVLFNLLKNALWAIKADGNGAIKISTYESVDCNVLQFKDTGPGIPPDVLPYVFEAFFSTKKNTGGTGIGLAFCCRVLRAFGGNIRCESIVGMYTSFFLEFPKKVDMNLA